MKTLINISCNYIAKWQIKEHPQYKITECKKIINCKTNRIIKETVVGYTSGFWIGKKFISKKKLNTSVEIISSYGLPF